MVRYYSNQSEGGSYEKTYSRGQEISLLTEEDMEVGYYWKWHRYNAWNPASGYWAYHKGEDIGEEGRWMTRDDYLSKLTAAGESICNLMDNSIRVEDLWRATAQWRRAMALIARSTVRSIR